VDLYVDSNSFLCPDVVFASSSSSSEASLSSFWVESILLEVLANDHRRCERLLFVESPMTVVITSPFGSVDNLNSD